MKKYLALAFLVFGASVAHAGFSSSNTSPVLNPSTVLNLTSSTVTNLQTSTLKFADGTTQTSSRKLLQAAQFTVAVASITQSQTFVPSTLTVSITPHFAGSKILVFLTACVGPATGQNIYYTIYRDSTELSGDPSAGFGRFTASTGGVLRGQVTLVYLDSPNTTSAVSYTAYFRGDSAANYTWGITGLQTIVVQEVGP